MNARIIAHVVTLAAVAACFGAGGYYFLDPAAKAPGGSTMGKANIALTLEKEEKQSAAAESLIEAKSWNLSSDALEGGVLSKVSAAAESKGTQVVDFRSDLAFAVDGLKEAPFTAVVEGEFGHVLDLLASLEKPDSRFGVDLVQISSSDVGPGVVRATIRITAFVRSEV